MIKGWAQINVCDIICIDKYILKEAFTMKKATKIIITAALISSMNLTALATEIPGESVPVNATNESIALTENLISGILFEVENGLGYADAQAQAQNIIFNAVIAGQTNGYGYADLMAIARNAIYQYRDIYLRPEFYQEAEQQVQTLISDIISEVESGAKDYHTAEKEAYIKILQSVNLSFSTDDMQGDFCYWDIPTVDSAYFNRARKLLLEAQANEQA